MKGISKKLIFLILVFISLSLESQTVPNIPEDTLFLCPDNMPQEIVLRDYNPQDTTIDLYWIYRPFNTALGDEQIAENVASIEASLPGYYRIEVYDAQSTLITTDTVVVKYFRKLPYTVTMHINNNEVYPNDTVILFNQKESNVFFSHHLLAPSPCPIDNFSYIVLPNDIEVNENQIFNLNFSVSGIYPIYVISTNGIHNQTFIFYIEVWNHPDIFNIKESEILINSDSLILNVRPVGEEDENTIVSFSDYWYYNNSLFINQLPENNVFYLDLENNSIDIEIPVNGAYKPLNNKKDFLLLLKSAYWEAPEINFKLYDPQGDNYPVFNTQTLVQGSIIGEPTYDQSYMSDSYTYFYGFIYNNDMPTFGSKTMEFNPYIDPQGYYDTISATTFSPSIYNWNWSGTYQNAEINGLWRLKIILQNSIYDYKYVKLDQIALLFNKELFLHKLAPKITWFYNDTSVVSPFLRLGKNQIKSDTIKLILSFAKYKYVREFTIKRLDKDNNKVFILTPNGDGINDYWTYILQLPKDTYIKIFNTNGVLVGKFPVSKYPQGWDGTIHGKQLPNGSYWFVIETTKKTSSYNIFSKGLIVLIK